MNDLEGMRLALAALQEWSGDAGCECGDKRCEADRRAIAALKTQLDAAEEKALAE